MIDVYLGSERGPQSQPFLLLLVMQECIIPLNKRTTDFIAVLKYATTEEGGRKTPAFSKYRPQVKFPFSEMQTSGQQTFIDKEVVYPGDTVTAEIILLLPEICKNRLEIGAEFEFREGLRVIGTGKITEILNKDLIK
jgi:elongation factor Tu